MWNGEEGRLPKAAEKMGTAHTITCTVDRPIPSPVTAALALTDPFLILVEL